MSKVSQFKNFATVVKGLLTGDQNELIAGTNAIKAETAVNSQLAAQNSELVDREEKLTEAEDALKAAKYRTDKITDGKAYIANIVKAKAVYDAAKDAVQETEANIAYFESLKKEFEGAA